MITEQIQWRNAPKFVIARRPTADVAISQYPAESWESHRRNRNCLPEIAPQGHFLALRAQGATSAFGLLAMTNLGAGALGGNAPKPATANGGH